MARICTEHNWASKHDTDGCPQCLTEPLEAIQMLESLDEKINQLYQRKAKLKKHQVIKKIPKSIPAKTLLNYIKTLKTRKSFLEHEIDYNNSYGGPDPNPARTHGQKILCNELNHIILILAKMCNINLKDLEIAI